MLLQLFFVPAMAQKKKAPVILPEVSRIVSYEVLENGDTINRLDDRGRKQGKWLIVQDARYGENGMMELGSFADNVKTGKWHTYSLSGVIQSEEFFRQGNKDSEARYYEDGLLVCIGHFLALKSKSEYDTIQVEDPLTNAFKPVVIKSDMGYVRHGFWTYYEQGGRKITKVLEYQADDVIYEKEYMNKTDSVYVQQRMKTWPHTNQEPQPSVWQLDKNKRPVKYTDFRDNEEGLKPNVKKKR